MTFTNMLKKYDIEKSFYRLAYQMNTDTNTLTSATISLLCMLYIITLISSRRTFIITQYHVNFFLF